MCIYSSENKYERLFSRGTENFSYAENMEDWEQCYEWYRKHKYFKKVSFIDWIAYLLTQSVKYILQVWEKYCNISMEELAYNQYINI